MGFGEHLILSSLSKQSHFVPWPGKYIDLDCIYISLKLLQFCITHVVLQVPFGVVNSIPIFFDLFSAERLRRLQKSQKPE